MQVDKKADFVLPQENRGHNTKKFINLTGWVNDHGVELTKMVPRELKKVKSTCWYATCPSCGGTFQVSLDERKKKKHCGCEFQVKKGHKTGKLTVLEKSKKRNKRGLLLWECHCECGNTAYIPTTNLSGVSRVKSCGCIYRIVDVNRKYGKLTPVRKTGRMRHNKTEWECLCDCGRTTYIDTTSLTSGQTESCGCLKRVDVAGKVFGRLTAIEPTKKRINKNVVWKCICTCGNIKYVSLGSLQSGHTKSCGCIGRSSGEAKVADILDTYKVNYMQEYTFDDLRNINQLPFDFALLNTHNPSFHLIEYEGKQHYDVIEHFGGKEEYKARVNNDMLKDKYCKDNNIPLTRIPYWDFDNIEEIIEDLIENYYNGGM